MDANRRRTATPAVVRPLDRELWGRRELWVRTAPSFEHDRTRYAGLRYQPSPAIAISRAREGPLLDRVLEAAGRRGIDVFLQVMAASPPGYRVQFSSAVADDQCLGPDGSPHAARVDRNASLASSSCVAYPTTLLPELRRALPGVAGFRLDWPEYPPYDFRSALFDFNPPRCRRNSRTPATIRRTSRVRSARGPQQLRPRSGSAADTARTRREMRRVRGGMGARSPTRDRGPLAATLRCEARRLTRRYCARAVRRSIRFPGRDGASSRRCFRRRSIAFPASRSMRSHGVADAVGVKLYTMHWPMLARYWARDLLAGAGVSAGQNALTAAIADLFGFTDALDEDGAWLRYPEPHEAHPVGTRAQSSKLSEARELAGAVPVRAFVHSYGPLSDVMARFDIAGATGLPRWINRYGYLSDQKLDALRGGRSGG